MSRPFHNSKKQRFNKAEQNAQKPKPRREARQTADTSWNEVDRWYDQIVGEKGHYYHQNLVIPSTLRLLSLDKNSRVLDLACGQGVLERHLPEQVGYTGIDKAVGLIKQAKAYAKNTQHIFKSSDITKPLPLDKQDLFTHATIILALQNIQNPKSVLHNAYQHLKPQGHFLIVLNHPSFRIPRQSQWGVDEQAACQYRRMNRYMSHLSIPIAAHPGKGTASETLWSFHFPLSSLSIWLRDAGFIIELIEEWCSDKTSTGKMAKIENRARQEFPLFMAILARKLDN